MRLQSVAKLPIGKLLSMCAKKKVYPTLMMAFIAVNRFGSEKFSSYQCPLCENWHLTSKRKGGA